MVVFNYKSRYDAISVVASILCAVHCLLLPIFFSTLPLLGIELLENFWIELAAILVTALVGGWAIYKSYIRHHRNKFIVFLFLTGITMFFVGDFLTLQSDQVFIKLLGGISIVIAHIYNWYASNNSRRCNAKKLPINI